MKTSHYHYPVRLSEEQRRFLETMVLMSSTPAKHYVVARVLLMCDQRRGEPSSTDGQKASVLSISRRTVIRDPRSGLSKSTWGGSCRKLPSRTRRRVAAWMAGEKPN
jgi:hypothetical protein